MLSIEQVQAFLYREARALDDRDWDTWLGFYDKAAEFWMPAWKEDDSLVTDPHTQISLIFYPSRAGLEDRIFRIRTERSSASMPEPRTSHNITNVEILEQEGATLSVRFNWVTYSHRYKATDVFFGTSFYTLNVAGESPVITRKKVVLKNDYIRHVIDVYHI
jgi:benzoate/toluate 1,2-dioxygenase beta subunit